MLERGTRIQRIADEVYFKVTHYYSVKEGDILPNGFRSSESGFRVVLTDLAGIEDDKDMRQRDLMKIIQDGKAVVISAAKRVVMKREDENRAVKAYSFFLKFDYERELAKYKGRKIMFSKCDSTTDIVQVIELAMDAIKARKSPFSIMPATFILEQIIDMIESGKDPVDYKEKYIEYRNETTEQMLRKKSQIIDEIKAINHLFRSERLVPKSSKTKKQMKNPYDLREKLPKGAPDKRCYIDRSLSRVVLIGISQCNKIGKVKIGDIINGLFVSNPGTAEKLDREWITRMVENRTFEPIQLKDVINSNFYIPNSNQPHSIELVG